MSEPAALSYACATSTSRCSATPSAANLAAHRRPARRTARRSSTCAAGRRWTYAELAAEVDASPAACSASGVAKGDRVGIWAPNCAEWVLVQFATARIGAILVNINPAYRTHELAYVLEQSGVRDAGRRRRAFKTSDYLGDGRRGPRPSCPALQRRGATSATDDWDGLLATARPSTGDGLDARDGASSSPDDPINIQYTSGTTGFPKGATLSHHNILNNGFFVGETLRLHRGRPRLHPGAVLPLLRHGARQPRRAPRHGACMVIPGPAFDPAATLQAVAGRALHVALRRADDVHRRARPPRLRRVDLSSPAHGDHGRLAVPRRGDEAGHRRMGMRRGHASATA